VTYDRLRYHRQSRQHATSGMAIAGFTLALLGWLTLGILAVPAVILCTADICASRGPHGLAIAGLILGLPAVGVLIFFTLPLVHHLATVEIPPGML